MPNHFTWLSAPGLAALSVLHLRGEGAAAFLRQRGWRDAEKPHHVWLKNARGEVLDEVMVAREDGGFTVTCHGGPAVRAAFEAELCEAGFSAQEPAELPLFGAKSRYKRETLRLLSLAQSNQGVRYCLWAFEHGEAALESFVSGTLKHVSAADELGLSAMAKQSGLELPADRAKPSSKLAQRDVLSRSEAMRHFFDPYRVHLWGPVNAGKSSLLNALCGEHLAAVGEEPGLTRDVIEGRFERAGYTIRVFDTPGELAGGTDLEQRAFREAREQRFDEGDCVLHLVPPGASPPAERKGLVVYSRADEARELSLPSFGFPCSVSTRRQDSIDRLKDCLVSLQLPGVSPESGNAFALSGELREDLWAWAGGSLTAEEIRRKWL